MSTAGKVLISLILLTTITWIVAIAGVDQLNRNGNELLAKLNERLTTVTEQLKQVQHDVDATKDQITLQQESTDREITRLRARQADVERARSQTAEILSRAQIELATLQTVVKNAQLDRDRRLAEKEAEDKAFATAKAELTSLQESNAQMLSRIADLREKFRVAYRAKLDQVGK